MQSAAYFVCERRNPPLDPTRSIKTMRRPLQMPAGSASLRRTAPVCAGPGSLFRRGKLNNRTRFKSTSSSFPRRRIAVQNSSRAWDCRQFIILRHSCLRTLLSGIIWCDGPQQLLDLVFVGVSVPVTQYADLPKPQQLVFSAKAGIQWTQSVGKSFAVRRLRKTRKKVMPKAILTGFPPSRERRMGEVSSFDQRGINRH